MNCLQVVGLDLIAMPRSVGSHVRIMETFHGQVCNVSPFNDAYSPMTNVLTVNMAYAIDTTGGKTYILNVNQALDFTETMEHSLLCENQARSNNVVVDGVPTTLDHSGTSTHSVYFPEQDVRFPLSVRGPTSYLPVLYPTDDELKYCTHLDLTSGDGEWDPDSVSCLEQGTTGVASVHVSFEDPIGDEYMILQLPTLLLNLVTVNTVSHTSKLEFTPEVLASQWNISLRDAKCTLQATT